MSLRTATRVAWSLWLIDVVVVGALLTRDGSIDGGTVGGVVFILAFSTTGALVASRIPSNLVGWLLCLAAFAFVVGGICETITGYARSEGADGVLSTGAAWVSTFVWMLGVGPAATFVLLLFPDGRLPSRRWRPVAWLAGVALAAVVVASALEPGPIEGTTVSNPLGIAQWAGALAALETAGLALLLVCILASCLSPIARYRGAGAQQRQQLKWLAWALPVVLAWLATSIWIESWLTGDVAADVANLLSSVGLTIIPAAIAVAILRHRLYDIDLVIKRTLVYGALTATLLVTYLAMVLLLQLGLSPVTSQSDLAVAASTLGVAALFRPLRGRIQRVVDQRFFRSRYDAARTLETFAGRLRDELDVEALKADLRTAVSDAMAPAHVTLWLRSVRSVR